MKSLIDILDFSVEEIDELIYLANDIIDNPKKYSEICKGKKLANLFFEPSTRTRLSFEAAMYELGGNVIGFSEAASSSVSKGESVADTTKVISCYADIIVIRHPKEGAAYVAANNTSVPVINAGDGGHCHPTQTLADLLTIYREKGRLKDLTIGFCGDLKYGRTVHSLINALTRYDNINMVFISPKELKVPNYIKKDLLENKDVSYEETTKLEEVIPKLDILYMTRIQKERFLNAEDYLRLKDSYVLTPEKLNGAKSDMSIMHPLPRVNEISVSVDKDSRACYFKQVLNGKYIRMALIIKLLKESMNFNFDFIGYVDPNTMVNIKKDNKRIRNLNTERHKRLTNLIKCNNPRCITSTEQELEHIFELRDKENEIYRCIYCEAKGNR